MRLRRCRRHRGCKPLERAFGSATDAAAVLLQEYHSVMQAWRRRRGIFKEVWCVWHVEAPCGMLDAPVSIRQRQFSSSRPTANMRWPQCGRLECRDPLSENISRKKAVFFEEVGIEDDAPGSLQKVRWPSSGKSTRFCRPWINAVLRCRFRTSSAARGCGRAEPLVSDLATAICRRHNQRNRGCAPSRMDCGPQKVAWVCATTKSSAQGLLHRAGSPRSTDGHRLSGPERSFLYMHSSVTIVYDTDPDVNNGGSH